MSNRVLTLEQVAEGSAEASMLKLHDVLRLLINTLALPLPLDEMLGSLATMTLQALRLELCVIMLKDEARNCLNMCTCSPDLSDKGVIVQPVHLDATLWESLCAATLRGQLPSLHERDLEILNPLKNVQYKTLFPVPLFVGTECIGLLNCYSRQVRQPSHDDQLMLHAIAGQAALAIKHRRCVEEDVQAQKALVKAFVEDLFAGKPDLNGSLLQRASFLSYDLTRPHVIALIELSEVEEPHAVLEQRCVQRLPREELLVRHDAVIGHVKQCIDKSYPGSLVAERENILVCLLNTEARPDLAIDQLNTWLDLLVRQMQDEHHIRISAGVGNPCHAVSDYPRGYAEANEALRLGRFLDDECHCTSFNDLGAYRYIYQFAHTDTLRDQYQNQIASIVEYDRRKKTNLLDTLEIYLECGGNIAKTASLLEVHRNTLLQRLDRLQKLCALDLEQMQNRLPLLIALKVHRLRVKNNAVGYCGHAE